MLKPIKTDIYTFETLRNRDCLYVDKTRFVWELVKDEGIYFLSRPRRFGKSLLLSTFEAFFQGRRDLFAGLEIERLAPEKWNQHPVLSISMTKCGNENSSVADIQRTLLNWININARDRGVDLDGDSLGERFESLIVKLNEKHGKKVVVLIDEYDKPILDHLMMDDIHQVLSVLKQFYQVIKDCNKFEQFVFITGVTKFAHTSLFSGINNPTDLTMNPNYATMLGYTDDELRANFAAYITKTAQETGMDEEAMLARMKKRYDGFRFATKASSVYNPVSVGKFFYNGGQFNNYWSDTGTPSFFLKAARETPMSVIEERRNKYVDQLSFDKYEVDKLDPFVFAVQCGYLTLQDTITRGTSIGYRFDYPNDEIRETFSTFLLGAYSGKGEGEISPLVWELKEFADAGRMDDFLVTLQRIFKGLAFGNDGDDRDDPVRFYEGHFRDMMTFLMTLLRIENEPETRNANGQVDLVCCANGHRYIFELKAGEVTKKTKGKPAASPGRKPTKLQTQKINKLLDAAIGQAHEKGYYEKYLVFPQDIQLIALAFDLTSRTLVGSRVERIR